MGINKRTLNRLLNIIDASGGRRGSRKADYEGFEKWKNAGDAACSSVSAEDSDEYEKLDKEILEEDRDRRESNYRDILESTNVNVVNYNDMFKNVYKDVGQGSKVIKQIVNEFVRKYEYSLYYVKESLDVQCRDAIRDLTNTNSYFS